MLNNTEYVTDEVVNKLKCLRCDWTWVPRKTGSLPLTCPNKSCHSPYWRLPRTNPRRPRSKPKQQDNGIALDNTE